MKTHNDPFSEEQMIRTAEIANDDYENGRVMTMAELEEEVKKW